MLRMDIGALDQFLDEAFPQARTSGFEIDTLDEEHIVLRLPAGKQHLRPGGTVNGPVIMMLADLATYLLVLAHLGPVALAVTTSLNINFMRKPKPGELLAEGRLLKMGKRIVVADVRISGASTKKMYAQATVTYSLPPER
ncbi:MAG: PaaI family thioesterase [Myxococcota bacterium]